METNDISHLATLLRENGDKVLNGLSKLSLTVKLLKNLNEAFAQIVGDNDACSHSFEVIKTNSPMVDIFHDIQFLHDFVQKTVSLKLTNCAVLTDTINGTVDISKFKSLKYLELRKVPLRILNGIQNVRTQLQSIVCIRCIRKLEELLFDCGADHSSGFIWSDLREAVFSYNGIDLIDSSLELVPWLQILDLSHNKISNINAVNCLPNLKYLNLSYNLLESLPVVHKEASHKLQVLVIKNNYIEDLTGLQGLESLMELDLSCNCLLNHESLNPLRNLSALTWLSLEGNPLSFHTQHRTRTVRYLNSSAATGKFILDRVLLSKSERLAVGSSGGMIVRRNSSWDDSISAGSSSSEKTIISGRSISSKQQQSSASKRRVREAVISDTNAEADPIPELVSSVTSNSIDLSTDHLETKKQIETIRQRFGEENWLHSHAGFCVQGVLGLPSIPVPSPIKINEETHVSTSIQTATLRDTSTENAQNSENTVNPQCKQTDKPVGEQLSTQVSNVANVQASPYGDNSDTQKKVTPLPFESEEEVEDEGIDEEEEDEAEEHLYLVKRLQSDGKNTGEFFFVVTERWIKEKEAHFGKTLEKWTLDSLLSCVRTGGNDSSATVHLTFDTIRRDRQERFYTMDEEDAQKLVRILSEVLESRPLNQLAFRCMKCSTQFSQEAPVSGVKSKALTCPTCNSTLVIEMDEVPLPACQKENKAGKPEQSTGNIPPATAMNSSPSQSSIGKSGLGAVRGTGVSTVTGGGNRLQVTAMIHYSEAQQLSSCSATSLEPFSDSPNNTAATVKRWDSDIEIISNPSQSSIEVLDEHSRLQGCNSPARKKSSEERQIVSVVVPAQHPVITEGNNQLMSVAGLTESSSSGSFTDSICTTYEIHSSSLPSRQGSILPVPKFEKSDTNADLKDERNSEISVNGKKESGKDTIINASYDVPDHDDENSMSPFKMHEKTLSPKTNYALMLEGLLQNVGSKLPPKSPENLHESERNKETGLRNDRIKYSYVDFSVVDHRVKLYLYQFVFLQEQEDLLFLIRAHIIHHTLNPSFPGLFVVSTKNVYVMQVTGEEGDDPEQWLRKIESNPLGKMLEIHPLFWYQGVGIELQYDAEDVSVLYLILQDRSHTNNFLSFLNGVTLPEHCKVKNNVKESQTSALQKLLTTSVMDDDADTNIQSCNICSCFSIQRNEDIKDYSMGVIVITTTDLLITDNLEWFTSPSRIIQKAPFAEKMSNLLEVGRDGAYQLILTYLDEIEGIDEIWTLTFSTESSLQSVVSAIKTPWEKLFSVPLTVVTKQV